MLIIYRHDTGAVVQNSGTNSLFPEGPPDELFENYPEGEVFGYLRLHDELDAGLVNAALTRTVTVVDGRLVVGDVLPPPETAPTPPTTEELNARLDTQQRIIDALVLGGIDDHGGGLDDVLLDELPDDGGSLGDLDGLDGLGDLATLPDSGETLESLGSV